MEQQVSMSFDPVTRKKIFKSLFIAVIAPAVVFALERFGDIHFHSEDPAIDYVLIYVLPIFVNAAKEFLSGKTRESGVEK